LIENFELKLNTIAKAWVGDEYTQKQLQYLGVNPSEWPECVAKSVLLRFEAEKDREYARVVATNTLIKLESVPVPEDGDVFRIEYRRELLKARGLDLARRIEKNPERVEDLISDFRTGRDSAVIMRDLKTLIGPTIQDMERRIESGHALVVLKGWERLSVGIGGFNPQRVSLLVAGSGVGKTMFALNLAMSANKSGHKVLFFNMEMGETDIVCRIIQAQTHVSYSDIIRGKINFPKIEGLFDELLRSKDILISDGSALTLDQIISAAMVHLEGEKNGFVFVDYDQKIISRSHDEEWKSLLKTVERLEECAKKANAHIMILSQGNDEGEVKASRRAKQPASTVLHFGKTERNEWFVRTTKNRFGEPNFSLSVDVDGATSRITEKDPCDISRMLMPDVGF